MTTDDAPPLILASASPRRRELLQLAGLRFEIDASDVPEVPRPAEPPAAYAARMACEKARCVRERHDAAGDQRAILAADTVVVVDRAILGKPTDRADARQMIARLAGRTHAVVTAFCALSAAGEPQTGAVTTEVRFVALRPPQIERYLDRAAWQDKAGAYAIQEHAAALVRAIRGSYSNVVGLPLAEVLEALARAGVHPTE